LKRTVSVSLSLLLLLVASAGCGRVPIEVSSPPPQPEVSLEEWAARYPNEYRDWEDSVHGAAYLAGDPDAPGCTSCHGDPASGEIQTAAFRLEIPSRCASCHADEAVMSRHDLPSDTYATYIADDYHGKTVAYSASSDPTLWRYEAVCSDCHRSHAVYGPNNLKSSVAEANLLDTCQKCHLGATPNFVDFASGHFRWSRMGAPLVHYVSLAYKILIPLVIGLMLAYIALDVYHRLRTRFGRETS
jgi:hypothetical protein